ncbi:DUF3253 domain-containing protein [Variovorax paradoxus]|uniref:DUF3253 domain-containing protein n=1 Tax=Variovorax paradoxus TaxID=34073 RepID=UPI001931BB62|nr:DUF3253 domain-containing protein [Variovorax paradoxus]
MVKIDPTPDADIEAQILRLLDARRPGASICPSEVARALKGDDHGWRALMPRVRQVAQRLARHGQIEATRGGVVVDAMSPGGPIRLTLKRAAPPTDWPAG